MQGSILIRCRPRGCSTPCARGLPRRPPKTTYRNAANILLGYELAITDMWYATSSGLPSGTPRRHGGEITRSGAAPSGPPMKMQALRRLLTFRLHLARSGFTLCRDTALVAPSNSAQPFLQVRSCNSETASPWRGLFAASRLRGSSRRKTISESASRARRRAVSRNCADGASERESVRCGSKQR
jgi:hypothetical protein